MGTYHFFKIKTFFKASYSKGAADGVGGERGKQIVESRMIITTKFRLKRQQTEDVMETRENDDIVSTVEIEDI